MNKNLNPRIRNVMGRRRIIPPFLGINGKKISTGKIKIDSTTAG